MLYREKVDFISSLIILIASFPSMIFGQGLPARASLTQLRNSAQGTGSEQSRICLSKDGFIRFAMAGPSRYFPVTGGGGAEQMANVFVNQWKSLLVNDSPAIGFDTVRVKASGSRSYVRLQQTYAGLEVFGAQMIVQVGSSGGIEAVISDIMRDTETLDEGQISLRPTITSSTAQIKAIQWMEAKYPKLIFEASLPTLMIFDPQVVGWKGESCPVWFTIVSKVDEPSPHNGLLVNAYSGDIIFNYSLVFPSRYREVYDADNTSADPGTLRRAEGGPIYGLNDVDDCYDYMGDTYDFYLSYHGRDSYDNNGSTIEATVRYCYPGKPCPWWGAFWVWSGEKMYIGKDCVTDDTVGHEFTHGVTRCTSDLYYAATESGAINESFSDMWGEWIDQTNGAGNDSEAVKWYLFEDDIYGAFRNMKNPHEFNHPEKLYESGYWYDESDLYDFTHINNGVGNKLCYLLTDGDTFNGYIISGMGISQTADLFYECQTNLLTSSANYHDLGNVLQLAASNIGLDISDVQNIINACKAVEIYLGTPIFFVCDDSDVPVAWFDDIGNLFLKGTLTQFTTPSPSPSEDEFIVKYGSNNMAMINTTSGDMVIKGSLSHVSGQLYPPSGSFVVNNSNGDPVAFIGSNGHVRLKGYLIDN